MKAIILAAGIGRRMLPLTDDCHKTLSEVGGRAILGRILDGLEANGITEVYIVTGYRSDKVEKRGYHTRLAVRTPGDNNRLCAALCGRSAGVGAPYGHG